MKIPGDSSATTCALSSCPDVKEVLKSVPPLGEAYATKCMILVTP